MYTRELEFAGAAGLGGSTTTGQIISGAGVATGATVGLVVGGPLGAAIGAGIGLVTQIMVGLFGHGCAECVATTHIVDQVEPILKQNLAAYLASSRSASDQAAALANFDYAWSQVVQACSNPQFGAAGQNCIADRQRGATSGYDWFQLYRDPIANDTTVQPSPVEGAISQVESVFQSGNPIPLLLAAGLALWMVS